MLALIFDTETTGLPLHPEAKIELQPHIIEWGGVLVDGEKLIEEYHTLINPGEPIPPVVTKINGITDAMVKGEKSFRVVADDLRPLFQRADALIAHNLPFDSSLMRFELQRAHQLTDWPWPRQLICTVQEHVPIFGRRPRLLELYEYYMGHPLEQTHRALDDVNALWEICLKAGILT